MKVRKGDMVYVTTGSDKNQKGKVLRVLDKNMLVVDNINTVKKHVRPNAGERKTGKVIIQPVGIHVSNVLVYNPRLKKGERIGYKMENGKKIRYFKPSGDKVDSGAKALW